MTSVQHKLTGLPETQDLQWYSLYIYLIYLHYKDSSEGVYGMQNKRQKIYMTTIFA